MSETIGIESKVAMKLNEQKTGGHVDDKERDLYDAVLENFKGTPLYVDFLREKEEILRHKWLESEKAGRDIGFEEALTSWLLRHRGDWVSGGRSYAHRVG